MAQPSVVNYFNTRKRGAVEDIKVLREQKVLILDGDQFDAGEEDSNGLDNVKKAVLDVVEQTLCKSLVPDALELAAKCASSKKHDERTRQARKAAPKASRTKKAKEIPNQRDIQELLSNMNRNEVVPVKDNTEIVMKDPVELLKTPPPSPLKKANALDKLRMTGKEPTFNEIKQKLTRSSRLAELKASMAKFKETAAKLDKIEQKTLKIPESPGLKAFKSIELEVAVSPTKPQTPEKSYLSPRKDTTARKNLFNLLSPTKNAVATASLAANRQLFQTQKPSLTLPFKYRTLAEIFRSIDTVCQIMHNRNETVTFRKLKPAVEELLKRNLYEKHLAQIQTLYPEAFSFTQKKLRVYGTGIKHDQWELVVAPVISQETMTPDNLLDRRRKLYSILIEKCTVYHQEFLLGLEPPMVIPMDKITRWHPEFDIEKVPDIDQAELPQPPAEEKFTTGKDVLDKAKMMFNCNTRMELALQRLKETQDKNSDLITDKPAPIASLLKGVPKSLLEKVRQKQAAKALESMTRSDAKDLEVQLYSRLPEFARLTRNLFVAEKKSVLPVDILVDKLSNSIRTFMTRTDIVLHLKTLSKEVPGWLVFHTIRNGVFVKISKDADVSLVLHRLDKLIKQKTAA